VKFLDDFFAAGAETVIGDGRDAIRRAVVQAWQKATDFYDLGSLPLPEIDFGLRGRCAAQAGWRMSVHRGSRKASQLRLRFNLQAYAAHPAEMLNETVPHEIAHLIVVLRWGAKCRPHGAEWRSVMQECFALEPQRTHSLPLKPSRTLPRDFVYACTCRKHYLTRIRHGRIERGQSVYRCRNCGDILRRSD
jgi:SprT protein